MLKKIKQIFLCLTITSMFISGITTINYATNDISENDKNDIKNTVEVFVKEDFNFNGGKNIFSTVGSDDFKEYLKARNDLKQTNNDNQGYKVLNSKYSFEFKNIISNDNVVKVDLYVSENFSYDLNGKVEPDASAGNDYDIYLSKIDGYWKIVSATINAKVDPVDSYFNVNKELGYEKTEGEKNSISVESRANNLENMLQKIKESKSNLSSGPLVSLEDVNSDVKSLDRNTKLGAITNSQRQAIYDYAYTYREWRRNPNYYNLLRGDCANYASQAMRKAGARADNSHAINIDGKNRTWSLIPDSFHVQPTYGDAWAQAHYLRAFITRNANGYRGPGGGAIQYGSTLQLGDLTFLHDGKSWFHTLIVTEPGPNFKVSAHTVDRWKTAIDTVTGGHDYARSYVHLTTLN